MKRCMGILSACYMLFVLSGCQSAVQTEGLADPTATIYKSVRYRYEDVMKGFELWHDKGPLILNDKEIIFVGKKNQIKMVDIQDITYGRLSKTIITDSTKWVKIDYVDAEGNPKKALFMNAKDLGLSGWLGGNKKMYEFIKQKYEGIISK